MRISGGKAKGTPLQALQHQALRPTTSLTRQATFSMLQGIALHYNTILDLFAGTGALGIEALSRGALSVDFVEQKRQCCQIIHQNLRAAGLATNGHVYCCSVQTALGFLNSQYDVVFLDPPYSDQSLDRLILRLTGSGLLGDEATVVILHSVHHPLAGQYERLTLLKQREHGDTSISIFRREV